jgi:5-formyltetrahydrofolate cyclo-ligase
LRRGQTILKIFEMKHSLKQQILQKRKSLSGDEIKEKSGKIRQNLYSLPEFQKSKNIMFYVSVNNEVDTHEIIKDLLSKKDKTIIIPYMIKNNPLMQLSELKNLNELEPKTFGILEPKKLYVREFNPDKLDLAVIPGIVFDKSGHRIGYGYGYFDRFLKTLKNKTKKIGLAFDFQVVDEVPKEGHDVPVDIVVSENFIRTCSEN